MGAIYVALALLAAATPGRVYTSPDGEVRALVSSAKSGSRVVIEAISARALLSRSSPEATIEHAAWTADSQFFVVSTEALGGHQPWARPIWFYSRGRDQVFELSKWGVVAVADFVLQRPDMIQVKVLHCERPFIISLRGLLVNGLHSAWCEAGAQ